MAFCSVGFEQAMTSNSLILSAATIALLGCQAAEAPLAGAAASAPAASAQSKVQMTDVTTKETGWKMTQVVGGIRRPWGMCWLPDGRILITQKEGGLALVRGGSFTSIPIENGPEVNAGGQGGVMDVAIHPDYATNKLVYITLATGPGNANKTVLIRGKFDETKISNVEVLYSNPQTKGGGLHFGSRIVFSKDKTIFLTIGDGNVRQLSQDRQSHFGKVLHLTDTGKPAKGNPYETDKSFSPEVWSYGHRNAQGMAMDYASGRLYVNEHGARMGDEINLVKKAANYGWPVATFSIEYSGQTITDKTSLPGMEDPMVVWNPNPAPSGLAFYTGNVFPNWKGDLFSGGLAGSDIRRIDLDGSGKVIGQSKLQIGTRVRDVRQGPDGYLYFLTDEGNGRLMRIEPA